MAGRGKGDGFAMKLFHGTTAAGIDILRVNSRDGEGCPVLYLTDNLPYSLFYIRDRELDFVTCGVGQDGIVRYDEKIPGQLKLLYRGRAGYVYEVEASAEPGKVPGIWLCREAAKVTAVRYIPDVYEAIWAEIGRGTVEFLPYERLTPEQKAHNYAGAVDYLRRFPVNTAQEAFYRKYFPQAWEEAGKMPEIP